MNPKPKDQPKDYNLFWLGLTLGLLICAIALMFVQTNNNENVIKVPDVRDSVLIPLNQEEPIVIILNNNARNLEVANQVNLYLSQVKAGVGQ